MPNNWFRFKQFTIQQEHAAMKVGTDGVLLGAWASVPESGSRVLDVGTGTGLIALMMAQRSRELRDVRVDALEIDSLSATQARENFRNSPWENRLHCVHSSFQDYASQCDLSYDLVICNPPFFTASKKTESKSKNLARHDDSLSLEDLFKGSLSLMKKKAILSLILPIDKEEMLMDLIKAHNMHCNRITRVKPTPQKPAKRILLELSTLPGKCHEDELSIEMGQRHVYSRAYKSLTNAYYLGEKG